MEICLLNLIYTVNHLLLFLITTLGQFIKRCLIYLPHHETAFTVYSGEVAMADEGSFSFIGVVKIQA